MDETKKTKKPSIPSNYVSLLERRERWKRQQQEQLQQQRLQLHIQEREETLKEEKTGPQQQQQQQQQEQPIKQNDEESDSGNVTVKDDGGESSLTAEVGDKKKGKPRKNQKNNKKKKEEEEVKEEETGGGAREMRGKHEYLVKGEKENVVSLRNERKRLTQRVSRPNDRNLVEGSSCGPEIEQRPDNVVEESGWVGEAERNAGNDTSCVVKVQNENVVSRRNGRKRDLCLEFRPKVRDLVEGSSSGAVIGQKLDHVVEESGRVGETERNRGNDVSYIVKGEKKNVVSRGNGRKRDTRPEFGPKARDLVEGSSSGAVIGQKLDHVVEESGRVGENERNRGNDALYIVKGEKKNVVLRRNGRKRDVRPEFRPKARDLVEGSSSGVVIGQKLDNVVEECSSDAEVESNVALIEFEEDGFVEESDLTGEIEQKLRDISVEEENDRSERRNGFRGNFRHGYKSSESVNREYRRGRGRFSGGDRGRSGYKLDDNHRNLRHLRGNGRSYQGHLRGNGRSYQGGDGKGSNGAMAWVKKEEAIICGDLAEVQSSSVLTNEQG